jgi:hypothetical protein
VELYEVIRWGNDSPDRDFGGPDGPDTCFLVRAGSVEEAAILADALLINLPHERVQPWSHAVYHLGTDVGADPEPRVLRGPYVHRAFCHGWRQWHRQDRAGAWAVHESRFRNAGRAEPGVAPDRPRTPAFDSASPSGGGGR